MIKIISTIGDPNGIGIECLVKALDYLNHNCSWFLNVQLDIAGNVSLIDKYLKKINYPYKIMDNYLVLNEKKYKILAATDDIDIDFGKIQQNSGLVAAHSLEFSVSELVKNNYDILITMPISKEAIKLAGWKFPGHTEMIAHALGVKHPLMILFHNNIRVALITFHTPIKELPFEISYNRIIHIGSIFSNSLQVDFGIENPKIAILGLNPHAGENGNIGREELEIVIPALRKLQERGINANGPFSADGFFGFGEYNKYDGILAMYHDQGLIPLKLLAHGNGVNFTANLPIVRTSPDHGTAFDIAGKSIADPQSTIEAFKSAYTIYENRKGLI
ncbi:MAG: 4-hydroxythreonine-4-phosphate dehydrogenase PdxA [Ignavibacteria bacterium]|nr:4-hydroxythreonine-4-phosphate dehydrogenase PdxA [Ignavibacteria bacterium]